MDLELKMEMKNILSRQTLIHVVAPPQRASHVWIGGSIFASLCQFEEQLVLGQEYDEHGVNVARRMYI